MREVRDHHRRVADHPAELAHLLMRQFEEAVDEPELDHHLERRRMHRIAAKIAQEIVVLLEHDDLDPARASRYEHQSRRPRRRHSYRVLRLPAITASLPVILTRIPPADQPFRPLFPPSAACRAQSGSRFDGRPGQLVPTSPVTPWMAGSHPPWREGRCRLTKRNAARRGRFTRAALHPPLTPWPPLRRPSRGSLPASPRYALVADQPAMD